MGTLVGHVAPGFGFLLIGLWHLFNHTKLYAMRPASYASSPWFPAPVLRHLEPVLIMFGALVSIFMELLIGPEKHQPFDPDGTIPANHLHNFEHSVISFSFLIYAAFAIVLDRRRRPGAGAELLQLLGSHAFAQQLLLFRLHSADHDGVEGQYHLLLQLLVLVSLATTLMGIPLPGSFLTSFVRSLSVAFQGAWLMLMGFMLWTPALIPKGCRINDEDGHKVVRCEGQMALHRAKSLVNLQFSWLLAAIAIFGVLFYLFMVSVYGEEAEYRNCLEKEDDDVEYQQEKPDETKSFLHLGKLQTSREMER